LESSLVSGSGITNQRAILKRRILVDGKTTHFIVCKGSLTKAEKKFIVQVLHPNEKTVLHEQDILIKDVKWILDKNAYRDVIPSYYQIKHIRNCYQLMESLFISFIMVIKADEKLTNRLQKFLHLPISRLSITQKSTDL
jgi:hypothetical protein